MEECNQTEVVGLDGIWLALNDVFIVFQNVSKSCHFGVFWDTIAVPN